jgi:hypothetical protein
MWIRSRPIKTRPVPFGMFWGPGAIIAAIFSCWPLILK